MADAEVSVIVAEIAPKRSLPSLSIDLTALQESGVSILARPVPEAHPECAHPHLGEQRGVEGGVQPRVAAVLTHPHDAIIRRDGEPGERFVLDEDHGLVLSDKVNEMHFVPAVLALYTALAVRKLDLFSVGD